MPAACSRMARARPPKPLPTTAALGVCLTVALPRLRPALTASGRARAAPGRAKHRDRGAPAQDPRAIEEGQAPRVEAMDERLRQPVEALEHPPPLARLGRAEQHAVQEAEEALARPPLLGEAPHSARTRRRCRATAAPRSGRRGVPPGAASNRWWRGRGRPARRRRGRPRAAPPTAPRCPPRAGSAGRRAPRGRRGRSCQPRASAQAPISLAQRGRLQGGFVGVAGVLDECRPRPERQHVDEAEAALLRDRRVHQQRGRRGRGPPPAPPRGRGTSGTRRS